MQKKPSIGKTQTDSLNEEIILKGRAVSKGVGIGKTLCIYGKKRQYYRFVLKDSQVTNEIERFRSSIALANIQLQKISSSNIANVSKNQASIFETHQLFLSDKSLLDEIESTIIEQKVNAEWAVKNVTDNYIARYKTLSDKHLREKYIDLIDITERIFTALGGGQKLSFEFDKDTIIVAKEINPSSLIELSQHNPKALITENGGWTSHTFILARELNLPAITGVQNILRTIESGEKVIIDGFTGEIIINPSESKISEYKLREADFIKSSNQRFKPKTKNPSTTDGFEITVRANLDLAKFYHRAKDCGAKGIGLFRSEFLFNQNKGFPTEDEQFKSYRKIGELVGKDGIRIRTFDLNIDQLATQSGEVEKNPALGLRGIRLSKKFESEFRTQIRALLRASHNCLIDIILPMISEVSEIIWARQIIADEKSKLVTKGIEFGDPKLGSMIEVPAAVLAVDEILEVSDFLSVGTNDLVQYILAVDRDNIAVSEWFNTLHPSVLKSVKIVLDAANKAKKPAIICGEMAGSPLYVPILIAFGAKELSLNLNSLSIVQKIISSISKEETMRVVQDFSKCKSTSEIEELVRESFSHKWAMLFDSSKLDTD